MENEYEKIFISFTPLRREIYKENIFHVQLKAVEIGWNFGQSYPNGDIASHVLHAFMLDNVLYLPFSTAF